MQLSRALSAIGDSAHAAEQHAISLTVLEQERTETELLTRKSQDPKRSLTRLDLGKFYLSTGRLGSALPELQAAGTLDPGSKEANDLLNRLYSRLRLPQPAVGGGHS